MTAAPRASLVVLTGGRSRRMGEDKVAMDAGGVPLAARPARALADLCDDVVLAGRSVDGVDGVVVADEPGAAGPLGGVVAGLRAAARQICVVAGGDMPAIVPGVVALLLAAVEADGRVRAACCVRAGGFLEPLPFAIRRDAAPDLTAAAAEGRSLHRALLMLGAALVDEAGWARLDPEGRTFESWNRPGDVRPL